MSYQYQNERKFVFTEEGQVLFLKIRDTMQKHFKEAGASRMQELMSSPKTGCFSSWEFMACVDRLVELKEITEITPPDTMGQYRVFVRSYTDSM